MSRTSAGMTVCLITPYPPNKHGLSEFSQSLVRALEDVPKRRINLHVVSFTEEHARNVSALDGQARVHKILKSGTNNPLSTYESIPSLLRLLILLAELRPEIVHVEFEFTRYYGGTIGEPFILFAALAKRMLRFKLVSTLQTVWSRRWLLQRLGEVIKINRVRTVLSAIYASYYDVFEGLLIRTCDMVLLPTLTLGLPMYQELRTKYGHYAGTRILEVPHGVYKVSEPRKMKKTDSMTILSFGAIRRGKGQESLIEMVHRLKSEYSVRVRLVIAGFTGSGDTGYLQELTNLVVKYELGEQVTIIPRFLELDEVVRWHQVADAIIISYSRMVGPSGALMWAMATETVPIMMTGETWRPEVPGIVVHNQEEMMHVIVGLVKDDLALRQIRGEIVKYRTTYSFDSVAKLHLQLYQDLSADQKKYSSLE
jgi:glycosyltransferase involved in cell wall biosynthesis